MLMSVAVVVTDAPARYAKQLLAHLGHKVQVEPVPDEPEPAGQLRFAYGLGVVLPMDGRLVLRASADSTESLARVQDVLQRHLEKFGARRELVVTWGPADTSASADPADPGDPADPADPANQALPVRGSATDEPASPAADHSSR